MARVAGRYLCAVLLACAGLTIGGCVVSTDPGEDSVAAPLKLANEATARVCGIMATCCTDAGFPYSDEGCQALHHEHMFQHFQAQTFLGAKLDTAAAKRCLDEIGQIGDACPVDRAGGHLTPACDWLFKGTVPEGGDCDPNHGCATTREAPLVCAVEYDERGVTIYPGVCMANPPPEHVHAKLGQACGRTCTDEDFPCSLGGADQGTCYSSDGLFCSSESNQCERQRVVGEPCDASHVCALGSSCDVDESKCVPLKPLGAACNAWAECADDNYCTSGTCQLPPRATAEYCVGRIPTPPSN